MLALMIPFFTCLSRVFPTMASVVVRVMCLPDDYFEGLATVGFGVDGWTAVVPVEPDGDDDMVLDEASQGAYMHTIRHL